MTYTPITVAGTTATQRAFQLPSGEKVVVDIQQTNQQASIWNQMPEAHLALQIKVWQVNDDGTPALDARGYRLSPPVKNASVLTAALADGTADLTGLLASLTLDALDRISNWLMVYAQISAFHTATALANGKLTVLRGSGQTTGVNTAFPAPLTVQLKNNLGHSIPGITVTFAAPSTGASGTFAEAISTAITDGDGTATAPTLTANATPGSYSVTASVTGGPAAVMFALTNS